MGSEGIWDLTSLVWLEGMGVKRVRGKGIVEANSLLSLPWVPPGISIEIGN
jgi:hypothetical protein